jgi:thiol:disulfide interchange protein
MIRALLALAAWTVVLAPAALADRPKGFAMREELYIVSTYDPARDPVKDLDLAIAKANASGRRILLDIGGEWCIWCHILDDFLATNQTIGDAFAASFVIVKINWSPQNKNRKFLLRFPEASGYPHFYVLDAAGKLLVSQDTSPLERGDSYNPQKMLAFAQLWRAS